MREWSEKRLSFIKILLLLCCILFADNCWAEPYVFETRHAKYVFQSSEDIKQFNSSIDFSEGIKTSGIFSSLTEQEAKLELIVKTDALFEKVQRILDMRKKMRKVQINVYRNKLELQKAYTSIFKRSGNLRAWYLFRKHTIYMNAEDTHEGMLAHEMAHAIIDHFLEIRPPRASAEILARYVDEHLFDTVKTY